LIDKRWNSNIVDTWSFWGADCVSDHYLVAAKVTQRLSVIKQAAYSLIWRDLISGS